MSDDLRRDCGSCFVASPTISRLRTKARLRVSSEAKLDEKIDVTVGVGLVAPKRTEKPDAFVVQRGDVVAPLLQSLDDLGAGLDSRLARKLVSRYGTNSH